jgi:hypothetical protein
LLKERFTIPPPSTLAELFVNMQLVKDGEVEIETLSEELYIPPPSELELVVKLQSTNVGDELVFRMPPPKLAELLVNTQLVSFGDEEA